MAKATYPQTEKQSAQTGKKATIHGNYGMQMHGTVEDEYFHVCDVVEDGISMQNHLGQAPHYKPIPLSRIEEAGHRLEYV